MDQKKLNLLVFLLEVISEACDSVAVIEPDTDNPLYDVDLRYYPTFELDEEDIEVIKELAKNEPRIQELLDVIEEAR